MVTRVQSIDLADKDQPHHQLVNRLKYTHAREMLAEYRASNAMIGRTLCPVCDYLEQHIDDDVIDLERTIYQHPQWGPSVLYETIIGTSRFNDPSTERGRFIAEQVQQSAAHALTEHAWALARPYIEAVLHHPEQVFIGQRALRILWDHIVANNPNHAAFFEQPVVAAKLALSDAAAH